MISTIILGSLTPSLKRFALTINLIMEHESDRRAIKRGDENGERMLDV
jgi:hypothetical protein